VPPEHDHPELQQLVERSQQGDAAARDELFRHYLPAIRAFVRLRAGDALRGRENHSDIVQSACREALADLGSFRFGPDASFRGWLLTIAANTVLQKIRFQRAQRRDPRCEADGAELTDHRAQLPSPSEHAIGREWDSRFEAALEGLTAEQREVVLWSRVLGMTHREVAERTGRSEVAVRSLLSRALARLGTLLGEAD
jgi:RNA polymerase sigma-70 factor (ECF subfamily)